MKLWKLTDSADRTYGGCQWSEGVEHTASGEGELCGPGWIHAYTDPLLAVFLNSIHGNFDSNYHLWEAEGDVNREDRGMKVGCTRIRTVRRIPPPKVTPEQRMCFGILCALRICGDEAWKSWAKKWLSGEDRSKSVARAISDIVWKTRCSRLTNETDALCSAALAAASSRPANESAQAVFYATWEAREHNAHLPLAEIAREAIQ